MGHPQVFFITAFQGWNDASNSASDAIKYLIDTYDSHDVFHIDSDDYYDLTATRPQLCTILGHKRIVWPQTTFYHIDFKECNTQLILGIGPEPTMHWKDYCSQLLHFAEDIDATSFITLGSMFADCPHTRQLPISITEGSDRSVDSETYCGPIGIASVLTMTASDCGFDSSSIWVSIPEYLGADDCPEGALRLIESLSTLTGINFDISKLKTKAQRWESDAQMLVRYNDMLAKYVHQLEDTVDRKHGETAITTQTAQQLVKDTEEFLENLENKKKNDKS